MQLHMAFKKMEATEALKTHTTERSERLRKFIGNETEVNWVFYVQADEHVADLKVKGPHVDVFAQSKTPDMYHSIDQAVERVEKQLRKNKEILKDHIHRKADHSKAPVPITDEEE